MYVYGYVCMCVRIAEQKREREMYKTHNWWFQLNRIESGPFFLSLSLLLRNYDCYILKS